ncbi:hypothetical protein Lal_00011478 [Lupinus albus]|uniref:Putative transcription factor interactor and regulator CCHC(Zn) family n=1 Tax=Lupinus albus TaxID=3870 RepID=A0A6A5NB92_LUPAL|nr:putative transcription factor interactor and regulator CCHC(Zn) family [Lupinus albus]KAF1880420.1 hypothetical protein Lal_00011478 [Lupinus albus]
MVLSNKKLKNKLRAESSLIQNSLLSLPDSATKKTTLSKREKLRKLRSLNPVEASANDESSKKENGSEDLTIKKKKNNKKRKRKLTEENGDVADEDIKDSNNSNNTTNNKKKKMKKPKNNEGEAVQVTELTSQENGDVANEVNNNADKSKNKSKKKNKKKKIKKKAKNNGEEVAEKTEPATELTTTFTTTATSQESVEVPTKVYVGGIPYYSTEDDIRSYFESCGTITEVDCMYFPETGKFRGIAIISFKTEAAAKRALAFDGSDMGGFFLKIQPYKSTRAIKAPDFAPQILEGYNRIYVGNLSWDITEEELKKFFSNCNITTVRFGMDKETGEFRGYAHVDFSDSESLKTSLTLDQNILFGRPVKISCAVPLKKKSGTNTSSVTTSNPKSGTNTSSVATSNPKSVTNTSSVATSNPKSVTNTSSVATSNPKSVTNTSYIATSNSESGINTSSVATSNPTSLGLDAEKSTSIASGKLRRRKCYECGEKGHLLSECPKNKTVTSTTT